MLISWRFRVGDQVSFSWQRNCLVVIESGDDHVGSERLMDTKQTFVIEFHNVSISFDETQALQNINFTLRQGDMLCITGNSSSGKSVLLRLALGFLRPDEGWILINGQDITAME